MEGQIRNRNPKIAARIKNENASLQKRVERLEKAMFGLLSESLKPLSTEDAQIEVNGLKNACLAFCQAKDLDESKWKDLAF